MTTKSNRNKYFISSVTFQLFKKPEVNVNYKDVQEEIGKENPTIADVFNAIKTIRTQKLPDPKKIGNAGSFFRNPYVTKEFFAELKISFPELKGYEEAEFIKLPAAQLIDMCGWKGKIDKGVGVYQNQALVLCNFGGAKGPDVKYFAEQIQRSVKYKFGVDILPEVNIY